MRNRLHSICPYFAMFPETFVREKVERYSQNNDWVLDPFSGRGTTVLESRLAGRRAAAADINPVAFCLSRAKAEIPTLTAVVARIDVLEKQYQERRDSCSIHAACKALPPFFRRAFYHTTLRELMFLRKELAWLDEPLDCFIAALVLGSLHGEMDRSRSYFSNQMARTIALKPIYSVRYWQVNKLYPKKRRVFDILRNRAILRLRDMPGIEAGIVRLCDVRHSGRVFPEIAGKVSLVVSSPPYLDVTSCEEDQWLRLWFLGGKPQPTHGEVSRDDRYSIAGRYWRFIEEAWHGIQPLLREESVIVLRIGAKRLSASELNNGVQLSLEKVFSKTKLLEKPQVSKIKGRQTRSFNPNACGCQSETDFVFAVSR